MSDRFELVTYESARAALPDLTETWQREVYQAAAKNCLTENDPMWWFLVAQAAMLQRFVDELPSTAKSNGHAQSEGKLNGEALKMTPPQLDALQTLLEQQVLRLKSLPGRDDVASKQDLQALQQRLSQVEHALQKGERDREKQASDLRLVVEDLKFAAGAMNKKLSEAGLKPPEAWWMKWLKGAGVAVVVALVFFLAGRYADARQEAIDARQANARLVDALKRLPSASNVTTFLRSKGADLTIDKIKLADGRDGAGIIISPGTLKLGPPSMSQEGGNTLVPINPQ